MILVVVDRFTKYAHFISLKHPINVQTVAKAFKDNIFKLHGLPTVIVSLSLTETKYLPASFGKICSSHLGSSCTLALHTIHRWVVRPKGSINAWKTI
jgi:hypothetical protein